MGNLKKLANLPDSEYESILSRMPMSIRSEISEAVSEGGRPYPEIADDLGYPLVYIYAVSHDLCKCIRHYRRYQA